MLNHLIWNGQILMQPVCVIVLLSVSAGCCAIADRLGPTDESEIAVHELPRLGLDALHRGQFSEAQARFTHVLHKSPKNPQARHHLAQLLWRTDEREQAIEEMDAAVLHSGGDPDWTAELGRMLLEQGDVDAALRCADVALQTAPHHADAWRLRGDVLSRNNDLDGAKQAYHRSLTSSTGDAADAETLMNLAEIYRLEGKPLRARHVTAIGRKQPFDGSAASRAVFSPGTGHASARALRRSLRDVRQARPGMPENAELLLLLSECQWNAGLLNEARETLAATARLLPQDPRVRRLADALHAAGPAIAAYQ